MSYFFIFSMTIILLILFILLLGNSIKFKESFNNYKMSGIEDLESTLVSKHKIEDKYLKHNNIKNKKCIFPDKGLFFTKCK